MGTIRIEIEIPDSKMDALRERFKSQAALLDYLQCYGHAAKVTFELEPLGISDKVQVTERAQPRLAEMIAKAEELGGESRDSLARSLRSMDRLAQQGRVELWYDSSELSLGWGAYREGAENPFIVGGLIYHAEWDWEDPKNPKRLDKGSWSVHS